AGAVGQQLDGALHDLLVAALRRLGGRLVAIDQRAVAVAVLVAAPAAPATAAAARALRAVVIRGGGDRLEGLGLGLRLRLGLGRAVAGLAREDGVDELGLAQT